MKPKTKYLLLTLSIVGLSLMIFNNIKMYYWMNFIEELKYAKITFVIGIISFGLYFVKKKWRNGLTKIMIGTFTFSLLINIHLSTEYYKVIQSQLRLSKYYELTCEEMQIKFEEDKSLNEIQYFEFGLVPRIKQTEMRKKMKSEYSIEYHFMGDLLNSKLICYNKFVERHLLSKYGISIADFYKKES